MADPIKDEHIILSSLDQPQFKTFASLPPELRIKIYQQTFLPRRVPLVRHSSDPSLSEISGALQLVSREASQVFHEAYTLYFLDDSGEGIYFNRALDTLCLTIQCLKPLVDHYPAQMAGIRWLEIFPQRVNNRCIADELQKMPALQIITVQCWSGLEWKPYCFLEDWEAQDRLQGIWDMLVCLNTSLQQSAPRQRKPLLAMNFPPFDVDRDQFFSAYVDAFAPDRTLDLKWAEEEVVKSFQYDVPEGWVKLWPGHRNLRAEEWVAMQVI